MASTDLPAKLASDDTQQLQLTRALVTAIGIIQMTPIMSQPPTVPESAVPGESPASSKPVISLGALLDLPLTLSSVAMAFTIVGIIWGAA